LEVADLFVVNKRDRDGAEEVARELRQMLHLGAAREWDPPIVLASANTGEGIEEVWGEIDRHRGWAEETGAASRKRRSRLLREVQTLAAERFRLSAAAALEAGDGELADALEGRRIDPYRAAAILVEEAARTR